MKDIYVDIPKLTDKELEKLSTEIQNVLKSRKETKKKEAWSKLTAALEEYLAEFGDIEYEYSGGEIYISAGNNYHDVGVINGWD